MVNAAILQGRYRLEDQIASGGMGRVFIATDERLERRVAVKLSHESLAQDPVFVERFRREARAVATLSHPNIATVFDYGEDGGNHFIVMELIKGRDLSQVLQEEAPLSPERAISIASQVCEALGHAHAAGIVHRDVKPANVLIGDDDHVRVTDFGIARAVGDATLTVTGLVFGTANYISPEQAAGEKTTPRSDLYSLGIVVYEMLTGSVPFSGDSPIAVAMHHLNTDVPRPSSVKPNVPPALDEVVARATAKSPADRYPSAREMDRAIKAALERSSEPPAVDAGATVVSPPGDSTQVMSQDAMSNSAPRAVPRATEDIIEGLVKNPRSALLATVVILLAVVLVILFVGSGSDEDSGRSGRRSTNNGSGPGGLSGVPDPLQRAIRDLEEAVRP